MSSSEFNNRGFSMIELVIVIAVIAILSALIAPLAVNQIEQARYDAGAATLLDVTTLQSTRLDAAVSVEESRFDLFVNRLDIAFQDGTIESFLLNQLNTNIPGLE